MSKEGQDNKNVNNEQTPLNDNTNSNIQEQQEKTRDNNDSLTPEEVAAPSSTNISDAQNTAQVKRTSYEVLGAEVTSSDPVDVNRKDDNKQAQSSLGTNIGDTQDKEESINANTEATIKKEDEQAAKVNVAEKENAVQEGNTPNEVKEQVIANNASTEPDKQNADSVDKDLKQLLSRIDKGEPPQKLENAQVKNVLNSIKAQMPSAINNYAELIRLASALAALAASTNNPELLEAIQSTKVSVDSKAETAEQNIRNDVTSDNLEAQESIEQTEQNAHIAKYAAIKIDFHKKLEEDLELLDAAIDPSRATPEQSRILEDDLTDAEREELKRKAQLKKEGYEHVYNIKENVEKEIEQNNIKITSIDERLKTTKDDNQRQTLEAEKQQYIKTNEERKKELDDHVKDELAKRDKEREKLTEFTKLKERVEKHPEFAQRIVEEHFEIHAAEYEKNPDRTAINELHAMVRKVGLAEKLGVAPDHLAIEPKQAIPNINQKQEVIKQDLYKAINQVHEQYSGRPIPREETDKIANSIVHNEGYPHHIEIMKIEKMDKTVEQKLIKSIEPVLKLGNISPSNTPNKPTKGLDRKI